MLCIWNFYFQELAALVGPQFCNKKIKKRKEEKNACRNDKNKLWTVWHITTTYI